MIFLFNLIRQCLVGIFLALVINTNVSAQNQTESILLSQASRGDLEAQFNLGKQYALGTMIPQDLKLAQFWLRKAAEKEHQNAQFFLAEMYHNGRYIEQNWDQAIYWYQKAAENGHQPAQMLLAKSYYSGTSDVDRDYIRSLKWFEEASLQGNIDAQFTLAMMHYAGFGTQKNFSLAYTWANLSAARGNKKADKFRSLLKGKMSNQEMKKSAEISKNYLDKHKNVFSESQI